jgi:hypothetical protein
MLTPVRLDGERLGQQPGNDLRFGLLGRWPGTGHHTRQELAQ